MTGRGRAGGIGAFLGVVALLAGFIYPGWRTGRLCDREFHPGSERNDVCHVSNADRPAVCFNLENVPFMCSAGFLAGHPDLLDKRAGGVSRERERCAAELGVGRCSSGEWERWCQVHHGPHHGPGGGDENGEAVRRRDRCVAAGA